MEYRVNQKTGDRISVIGLGTAYIASGTEKEALAALRLAHENGINYADLATASAKTFAYYGKALADVRKDMYYQVHFGANYETGEYGWTTKLDKVKAQIDWMLRSLKTDYIDYGFIHCLDSAGDWQEYRQNGVLDYLLAMKKQGVVRHVGLSTHTPELANLVLDTGVVEQLMFSINPGYDYQQGEYANGSADERMRLYRRCEAEGVGITVMKPFAGGRLFDAKRSPFGVALTPVQCIHYCLTRPAVAAVMAGYDTPEHVEQAAAYETATREEKDYATVLASAPKHTFAQGECTYCGHCKPCPKNIDIAMVNKYYDLATMQSEVPATVKAHYEALEHHADECIGCKGCESRCPFGVKIAARMEKTAALFGNSSN